MKKRFIAALLVLALMLSAAGCGKKQEWVDYSPVYTATDVAAGSVVLECSDLGSAAMTHVAQAYSALQPQIAVDIRNNGETAAVEAFINKEADMVVTSNETTREQDDRIVAAYGENQVLLVRVATDALAVVVNAQNTAVTELTKDELCGLFTAGVYSDAVTWADLRAEWPAEKINRYGLPETDALMGYFEKLVLGQKEMAAYTALENSQAVLDAVAADPNGIAILGLSTCLQAQESVSLVAIDSGRGPIEPTLENITGSGAIMGLYSEFSFPLYVYVSRTTIEEKPQVFDYLWFVLSEQGIRVTAQQMQFLALTDEDYANQIDIVANRTKG